jgi:S1-C subfamily serine protease
MASTLGGLRNDSGVLVIALAGLGLAGQSAMEPADVIHAVNGSPVDGVESLRRTLENIPDGAPMVLQVERSGVLSYVIPGATSQAEQRPKKTSTSARIGLRPLSY